MHFKEEITKKWPQGKKKKVLSHQDNMHYITILSLQSKRFGSNEEVILEIEVYFEAKDKSFYKKGIVREVLESVYPPIRRLCWWIKSNFA